MNYLPIDYEKTISSIKLKKTLKISAISAALLLNLSPFFLKGALNNNAKLALSLAGLGFSIACCNLPKSEYENKLKKTYEETDIKLLKTQIQGKVVHQQTIQEIDNQVVLAETIERLPEHQIDYFAQKYGVAPIIAQYYIENSEEPETVNQEVIQNPEKPTIYMRQDANSEWIDTLVYEFTLPQGKRLHEHLMINGGTQAGKSTLVSAILAKIVNTYKRQGKDTIINLIDPKYPMTNWAFEPTFKGFDEVIEGVKQAIAELDNRKKVCLTAKKSKQAIPQFNPYLTILDEIDVCYGNKKGYGDSIDKNDAEWIIQQLKRIISEGAAYDVRLCTIGQSPLSQDNGFNRTTAKQTTRIVVGQEGLSWLQDPGFPFKKDAPNLIDQIEPLIKEEKRTALICPNKGAVKIFEIPPIEIKLPDEAIENSGENNDIKAVAKEEIKPIDHILLWCKTCLKDNGSYPSKAALMNAWQMLTGKELDPEKGLKVLIEYLAKSGVIIP